MEKMNLLTHLRSFQPSVTWIVRVLDLRNQRKETGRSLVSFGMHSPHSLFDHSFRRRGRGKGWLGTGWYPWQAFEHLDRGYRDRQHWRCIYEYVERWVYTSSSLWDGLKAIRRVVEEWYRIVWKTASNWGKWWSNALDGGSEEAQVDGGEEDADGRTGRRERSNVEQFKCLQIVSLNRGKNQPRRLMVALSPWSPSSRSSPSPSHPRSRSWHTTKSSRRQHDQIKITRK